MAEMTVAAWIAVASAAVSAVSLAISLSQGTPALGGSDQGALLNRKGVDNPRQIAYGKCLVPGAVVYKNVRNADRKWMTQVHSLGHGPFKKIDAVYIDEQPIFAHVGNDLAEKWVYADQNGFGNFQVGTRRGNYQNEVWPLIVGNGDGEWTDDMKGHSIASLQFLVERPDTKGAKDQEYRVMGTQFQSSALVEGVPVIDPTLDPMLLGISDPSKRVWMNGSKEVYRNPVYQLLSYLCDPMYGVALKPSMINLQTFINSAQWCEREGMKGDGYINQNDTYQKIIEGFASSWGGNIYLEDGKICCAPETVSPVVETIYENDLIGSMTVTNDRGGYANLIKVEWQDKDTQYNKNTFIIPSDIQTDPTIQEDGKVFERSVEIPMSTDIEYIKRYANRELKRERLCRKEAVFTINNLDKTLRLNDVFVINNELYGLDADTKWRVFKIEQSLDDKVIQSKITAIQYDSRVYDTSDYMDSNVGGDLGRPSINILPVADLRFVQNNTTDIGSGMLSFESQYYGEQTFRIQYKLSASSSSEWIPYGEFPFSNVMITGLQSGTNYDFKVQCAATIGSSKWSELKNQRVNKNISLPAVKNLSGNFTSANAVWTWDAINEPIVNNSVVANTYNNLSELVHYYEVAILHGVTTKKTYRTTTPNFNYLFDENSKNGLSRDVTARVTAISIYGDRGQTTSLKLFNEPMAQPSGVAVSSQLKSLTVTWDNPSEPLLGILDYASSDIYLVPTQQTVASDQYLIATSNTGTFNELMPDSQKTGWIRIAHRDVFGHTSPITASPALYYSQTTIDDEITDSQFDQNMKELEDNLAAAEADITKAKSDIIKNATDITTTKQTVTAQGAQINHVSTVASGNSGKIVSLETTLEATEADLNAKITTNKNAITTTNSAMSQLDNRLTASVGANTSAIQQQGIAITNLDSSLSSFKTSTTAEMNGIKGSVTTIQQTQANTDGKVNSLYTLKLTSGNKVSGLSLGNDGETSTFDVLSDVFRVASSSTGTPVTAFEVRNGSVMMRNALIGSLTASQISADAINGNHIAANSIIVAGSGATSATLNGSDPTWRIYAGALAPASAPFRVSGAGQLVATNANITGAITATSGSFTGAISASSGSVTGRLNVGTAYIDGRAGQNFLTGASGRFVVDDSGNMTCQYAVINGGTFNGTVSVDNLVGDIVKSGFVDYPHIPPSQKFISGGSEFPFLSFTFPVTSYKQTLHLAKISFLLTNGGNANYADLYWKFSNGSTIQLQRANSTSGGQPYDFKLDQLDNQFIEIPIGVSWVQLVVKPYTGSYISRPFANKSLWQSWKQGTGGIGVAVV
ncbi:phage tail tip fiber protein [Aeromonas salmonicida]|uniref:Putative phage tail fiber protein n=1 Tax=Aeromonas salmonicida subsp. pectinolytica 34mel TaxID=1324960 RepID=A0A2D1QHF1_AERSA|nr:DUF1983 domain-containing protein [Aeromonas salmonicida]ATP09818.1 putative phage tail fiber protein [Aeromonas salmonicida subsp. pectinolytica 34mel]